VSLSNVAVILAVLALLTSGVIAADSKCNAALERVDKLLDIYSTKHPLKSYPSTLKEFEHFAIQKGKPLDLNAFSDFRFERAGMRLTLRYTCKENGLSGSELHTTVTTD
jgi:hypothetical protein